MKKENLFDYLLKLKILLVVFSLRFFHLYWIIMIFIVFIFFIAGCKKSDYYNCENKSSCSYVNYSYLTCYDENNNIYFSNIEKQVSHFSISECDTAITLYEIRNLKYSNIDSLFKVKFPEHGECKCF